ncbi:MAG: hypothetical protein ABEJ28_08125 [Salinigranum sp.]
MSNSTEEPSGEIQNYALGKVTLEREHLLSEAEDLNILEESAFIDDVRIEDGDVVIFIGGQRTE